MLALAGKGCVNAADAERVGVDEVSALLMSLGLVTDSPSNPSSALQFAVEPNTKEAASSNESGLLIDMNDLTENLDIFIAMSSVKSNHHLWWRGDFLMESGDLISLFFDGRIELYHTARFLRLVAAGKTDLHRIEGIRIFDAEIGLGLESHRAGNQN